MANLSFANIFAFRLIVKLPPRKRGGVSPHRTTHLVVLDFRRACPGLVPIGINNWMATTIAPKKPIRTEIKLSVRLARVGSDERATAMRFGGVVNEAGRVVASAGTSPQRRANFSRHRLVASQLSLRPGQARGKPDGSVFGDLCGTMRPLVWADIGSLRWS